MEILRMIRRGRSHRTVSLFDRLEVQQVSEQNIKKFYETLARIISEREQVKITVSVSKKEKAA